MNLKERAKTLKKTVPAVFLALKDKDTPIIAKVLAGITVGYALSPIDLIPDFIPVLGYLDDVILLPALIALTIKPIPSDVWERNLKDAENMWQDGKPKKWYHVSSFMLCATLKNQKWVAAHQQTGQVRGQVRGQVTGQVTDSFTQDDKIVAILDFCSIPRSRKEIQTHIGLTGRSNFNDNYLKPLLASGKLKMTIPDKPNSRLQKYVRA